MLTKGKIIKQVNLNNNYYRIKIKAPQIAKEAKPGQFVMLSKWKINEIFLKRPFSFYKIESNLGTFDILYKKIGKGTKILAESKIGDLVELIGPLGNGFKIPKNTHNALIDILLCMRCFIQLELKQDISRINRTIRLMLRDAH